MNERIREPIDLFNDDL